VRKERERREKGRISWVCTRREREGKGEKGVGVVVL
jgi:hypothetical protein